MKTVTRIRWLRVLAGSFLAELVVLLAVIPVSLLFGEEAIVYPALVGSFVMPYLLTPWVSRPASDLYVVHGVLVGLGAILLYTVLTMAQPLPFLYVVAHVLKVAGGAVGGVQASRAARAGSPASDGA